MSDLPELSAPSPADGPTTPGRPAVTPPTGPADRPTDRLQPLPRAEARRPRSPKAAAATWIGLVLGAVVLVFLLVFILQNLAPVEVTFLGLRGTMPLGIWLLLAAVAGVLLLAVPGLGRRLPRRRARRGRMVR